MFFPEEQVLKHKAGRRGVGRNSGIWKTTRCHLQQSSAGESAASSVRGGGEPGVCSWAGMWSWSMGGWCAASHYLHRHEKKAQGNQKLNTPITHSTSVHPSAPHILHRAVLGLNLQHGSQGFGFQGQHSTERSSWPSEQSMEHFSSCSAWKGQQDWHHSLPQRSLGVRLEMSVPVSSTAGDNDSLFRMDQVVLPLHLGQRLPEDTQPAGRKDTLHS